MRGLVGRIAGLAASWVLLTGSAGAHDGPPYPIIVDQTAGPYVVSVWTDPDIGTGTFFVILAPAPGTTLPEELTVHVCVRPVSERLPEACSSAVRQELRDRVQYYAEVPFDQQEYWHVRVRVEGLGGVGEVTSQVEATPPGYGRWDFLIYGFPFLLFGLLWLRVALKRRSNRRNLSPDPPPPPPKACG